MQNVRELFSQTRKDQTRHNRQLSDRAEITLYRLRALFISIRQSQTRFNVERRKKNIRADQTSQIVDH
jgi:hypothetical protein